MKKENIRPWVIILFGSSVLLAFFSLYLLLKPSSPTPFAMATQQRNGQLKTASSLPGPATKPSAGDKATQELLHPKHSSLNETKEYPVLSRLTRRQQVVQMPEEAKEEETKSRKELWIEGLKRALHEKNSAKIGAHLKELSVEPSLLQPSDLSWEEKQTLKSLGFSLPSSGQQTPAAQGEEKLSTRQKEVTSPSRR